MIIKDEAYNADRWRIDKEDINHFVENLFIDVLIATHKKADLYLRTTAEHSYWIVKYCIGKSDIKSVSCTYDDYESARDFWFKRTAADKN